MGSLSQAFRLISLSIAAGGVLGACSTAEYGKPVKDFAAATSEAETVLAQLNTQLADSYNGVTEKGVLSGKGFVRAKSDDCLVSSTRCRLEVVDRAGQVKPYPVEPPLAQMALIMAQINKYAANLKSLIEADTASQAEGQVNAALGSVQNLAQTLAGPEQTVPKFATPAGAAVNWVVGQYVDHVKFSGLQRATAAAKPVVRDAANLFAKTAALAADAPRADLADETTDAVQAVRSARPPSGASLAAAKRSATRYDALLTTAPKQVFQRMAEAHDALAESLQGEGATLVTALARIEAFGDEAKKLAKILKDLHAVTSANPGG
jgi:hypothetical protein